MVAHKVPLGQDSEICYSLQPIKSLFSSTQNLHFRYMQRDPSNT
jgi:hypothetical protein